MPESRSQNPLPHRLAANACWFTTIGHEANNNTTAAIAVPNVIVVLSVWNISTTILRTLYYLYSVHILERSCGLFLALFAINNTAEVPISHIIFGSLLAFKRLLLLWFWFIAFNRYFIRVIEIYSQCSPSWKLILKYEYWRKDSHECTQYIAIHRKPTGNILSSSLKYLSWFDSWQLWLPAMDNIQPSYRNSVSFWCWDNTFTETFT